MVAPTPSLPATSAPPALSTSRPPGSQSAPAPRDSGHPRHAVAATTVTKETREASRGNSQTFQHLRHERGRRRADGRRLSAHSSSRTTTRLGTVARMPLRCLNPPERSPSKDPSILHRAVATVVAPLRWDPSTLEDSHRHIKRVVLGLASQRAFSAPPAAQIYTLPLGDFSRCLTRPGSRRHRSFPAVGCNRRLRKQASMCGVRFG